MQLTFKSKVKGNNQDRAYTIKNIRRELPDDRKNWRILDDQSVIRFVSKSVYYLVEN